MDSGELRTDLLPPALTPMSPSAEEHRPLQPVERKERRRSRFDDEASEETTASEGAVTGEHKIDRLA